MTQAEPKPSTAPDLTGRVGFVSKHQRQVLFSIKSANLGLITLYQFLLIYALTRTVGAEVYPTVVLLASIGNYILGSDLGFSGYVYAFVRERFIRDGIGETRGFINASLNLYMVIPALALVVAAVVIPVTVHLSPELVVALVIYFASIVFSLPWQMLRSIMMAIDGFMMMETLEFFRRLILVGLVVWMLLGLSFTGFAIACAAAWVVAFASAFISLHRRGIPLSVLAPRPLARFAVANRKNVAKTGAFGGMEFVLYNFPYIVIPILGLGGNALVFYDLFYKVTRFAGVAYNVPIETLLPFQTRAWHEGNLAEVRRYRRQMMFLCVPLFAGAAALLLFFGKPFFNLLLHDFPAAPDLLIYAMVVMMLLILVQATTGAFLVGVGRYDTLVRVGFGALALAVLITAVGFVFHPGAGPLMIMYVVGYGAYACLYRASFARLLRRQA